MPDRTRAAKLKAVAVLDPRYCNAGARSRGGRPCEKGAGWGTDHPGVGKCRLHGGATPIKHGRYSGIKRSSIAQLIEKHEADPSPLDVLPELAALRALFEDFVNRYEENRDALLAWYFSGRLKPIDEEKLLALQSLVDDVEGLGKGELTERQEKAIETARKLLEMFRAPPADGRPRQVLDLADAAQMLAEITRIVERVERIRAANAISRPNMLRVMAEMARVVDLVVTDEKQRDKVKDGWMGIRVA